jgi:prolyl oligopeptidase
MGHRCLYFENIEGGHGAAANLEQYVRRRALIAVFLYQKLMDLQ